MAKTWKRLLATLLAASMLMGMAGVAFAADGPEEPAVVESVEGSTGNADAKEEVSDVEGETPAGESKDEDKQEETPAGEPKDEDGQEETPAEEPKDEDGQEETPAEEPKDEDGQEETPAEEPEDEGGQEETPAGEPEGESEREETPAEKPEVDKSEGMELKPVMVRAMNLAEEPDVSGAKFAVVVSSRLKSGEITYVYGTVDEDYNAKLVLPNASVNAGNVTVKVSMTDVDSLGVSGTREHSMTLNTGVDAQGNLWDSLNGLGATALKDFGGATINASIASGGEIKNVTYTLEGEEWTEDEGKVITATAGEGVAEAWHHMVNEDNFDVGTQAADSKIVIANGSSLQIGTEKLRFEDGYTDDLVLDNITADPAALVQNIKNAVTLDEGLEPALTFTLKKGTTLAVSSSYAALKKDVVVTVDGVDTDGLHILSDIRGAVNGENTDPKGLIIDLINLMNTAIELVDGKNIDVAIEFKDEEVEAPAKFKVEVSSKLNDGSVTKVVGTVDKDYNAKLVLPNASVNAGNVTVKVSMTDVDSLGVSGTREHSMTLNTGVDAEGNLWDSLNGLGTTALKDFSGATVNASIISGGETKDVTYTLVGAWTDADGKTITGTPDTTEAARAAWQHMVNKDNFDVGTQAADSKIVIANGSSLQIGTEKLRFEDGYTDDLVLDNITADPAALVQNIKNAVTLDEGLEPALTFTLKRGTTLAVSSSYAALKKDVVVTMTGVVVPDQILSGIRTAINAPQVDTVTIIKGLLGLMDKAISMVNGRNVGVTIEFLCNHEMELTAAKAATCAGAGNNAYYTCQVCGKVYKDAEGKTETTVEDESIAAAGHDFDYANGVWTWAEDNSATLTATCKNDAAHTDVKTAAVTNAVTTPAQVGVAGVRTYTATVAVGQTTYTATKTETIPALSGGGGGGGGGSSRPTPTTPEENLGENDTPLTEKPFLFEDVAETDWFYDAVKSVFNKDLMEGVNETEFDPYTETTRGMVALILYRMEGSPSVAGLKADFSDLKSTDWYHDAAVWAQANGVYTGFEDGTFGGDVIVTREQLVTVLYRYAQKKGYDMSAANDLSIYVDKELIGTWAEYAMRWAVGAGLINGRSKTEVAPRGSTMRVELAVVLDRFAKKFTPDGKA